MRFRIADDFATSTAAYWEMFFSEDYNRGLWDALDIDWELTALEREGEGDDLVIRRELVLRPRREMPAFMRKLAGDALAYTERDVFTARDDAMTVETIPSVLTEKLRSHGVYRLEPTSGGVCRVYEGEFSCSIPIVGKKIEKHLVAEIEESYRKATVFTRRFLAGGV